MTTPHLLGPDDPCPCRSGKTFGGCCLLEGRASYENGIPVIRRYGPPPQLAAILEEERLREARFGQVRPAINANWQEQKWVAVGNQLLNSANWKTPADFLSDYLKQVMTPGWGKTELAKPLAERHPLMRWYDAMCRVQAKAKEQAAASEIFHVAPSGAMRAYILLAFDLYALQHHSSLQDRMLHRLRNPDQYQGARRELFAAATCLRAGFDVEYEDETDRSVGHVEFTATHRHSPVSFSVEAKSRGRPGVFAVKGTGSPSRHPTSG